MEQRQAAVAEQVVLNREQQLYDDTTTWLAEVLDGSMRTSFEYRFDGHELYGRDGRALKPIFTDAIIDAHKITQKNPNLAFELRRRRLELDEYNDMIAIARGELPNTMVIVSDFPPELMSATSDEGGYNVTRKQTMLRVLARASDGTFKIYSQSLDGSDREALEILYNSLEYQAEPGELLGQRLHLAMQPHEQELLIDRLTGIYDRALQAQYGGQWHAGRPDKSVNTYNFVHQQTDLLNAYLATTDGFIGGRRDYDLAAATEARYLNPDEFKINTYESYNHYGAVAFMLALAEMDGAGSKARALGKAYSGCGATINPQNDISLEAQLQEAGYGNKNETGEDEYGPLKFKCQKGHANIRPRHKLIPKCKTCGISVKC